jgi:diguanylate cyclase (GGDEF)-like protein
MILLDVDHFKDYNDAHGHPAGNHMLHLAAHILRDAARDVDIVARYGGGEFVLILPQTDIAGAALFAERLRLALEAYPWPLQNVTASFGVAALRRGEAYGVDIIARADAALYAAKAGGRNRIVCAPEPVATIK